MAKEDFRLESRGEAAYAIRLWFLIAHLLLKRSHAFWLSSFRGKLFPIDLAINLYWVN